MECWKKIISTEICSQQVIMDLWRTRTLLSKTTTQAQQKMKALAQVAVVGLCVLLTFSLQARNSTGPEA